MRAFAQLYLASVREFVRDRTALFWALAFPVMFIIIFGIIFSGGGDISFDIGVVNQDGPASARLVEGFQSIEAFHVTTGTLEDELAALKDGDRAAVIVIPPWSGRALGASVAQPAADPGAARASAALEVYYDAADRNTSQIVLNIVDKVVAGMNEGITGVTPVLTVEPRNVTSTDLKDIDYLLPGVLAMSLMQLGLLGISGPMVSLREKGVLRRMSATPLSKSTLLAAQVVFRLTTAFVQTAVIIVVGVALFGVHIHFGNLPSLLGVVVLGATTFITFGYLLSALAKTEDSVQGLAMLPNFLFMFLSGIFFPVEIMPGWIRPLVDVIPLTYLGDALRAVMIEAGTSFSMTRDVLVLVAWLVICAVLAVRFFKWEPQA